MSGTVMLIHGAWLTPASWENFRGRYETMGYHVIAPAWPHLERPVEELRRAPDPELRALTVERIVDHYEQLVRKLDDSPILIGHSFGGLVVQMLLDRGLGAAGVAIDPVPPRGVLPGLAALASARGVLLSWNAWNRTLTFPFEQFAADFAQTLPPEEQRAVYDRHIVPTPGRIFFQAATGVGIGVDYRNAFRAPLMLVSGERDRTITPFMVRQAYAWHRWSPVPTAFRSFAGRSHLLIVEPGWEEVADAVIDWASRHALADGVRAPAYSMLRTTAERATTHA